MGNMEEQLWGMFDSYNTFDDPDELSFDTITDSYNTFDDNPYELSFFEALDH